MKKLVKLLPLATSGIRSWIGNLKIKEKIFLITGMIVFGVCMISMSAFHVVADIYEDLMYTEAAEVLNLTSSIVDSELEELEEWSFQIGTDELIQLYLARMENVSDYENYKARESLYNRLIDFKQERNYVQSLSIIDALGVKHYTNSNQISEDRELYRMALGAEGRNVWLPIGDELEIISIRQIREMRNLSLSTLGVLFIHIDMERLVQNVLDFSEGKIFMISDGGEIIFTNQRDFQQQRLPEPPTSKGYRIQDINGNTYLISHLKSGYDSDLTYFNILPYEQISSRSERLRDMMILFFVVLFILILVISRRASHSISQPLVSLTEIIKQVQMGNFEIGDSLYRENIYMNEIGQLHRNFRIMLGKINVLFKENYQKQLIIHETEYKALQAQINPHFLYNTLDTVNWMARMNKQDQISEMVEALAHMLRSVVSRKEPLISLDQELQILKNYITIQKYRFDDRLDFSLDVIPQAKQFVVPKLTIQPLVENAIQHGLERITGECKIRVEVRLQAENLEITVSDTGPGMEPDVLAEIKTGNIRSNKAGIGIKNIDDRIKLLFGEAYGIAFESEPGRGTVVRIVIPTTREASDSFVHSTLGG